MNNKHLHIQNAEIRQDGSILIFFEEDAHTFLPPEDVKSLLFCLNELVNDNLVSFNEEE